MHDERLAVDARVDVRVVVHDVAERADDERQVREREALLRLPLRLVRAPHALDPLEVDLAPTCRRARSSPSTAPCARRCGGGCCRTGRPRRRCRARRAPARARVPAAARAAPRVRRGALGADGARPRRRVEHVVAGDAATFAACRGSAPGRGPARRSAAARAASVTGRRRRRRGAGAGRGQPARARRGRGAAGGAAGRRRRRRGAAGGGGGSGAARAAVPEPAQARRSAAGGRGAGAAPPAPSEITASRAPTSTVSPSGTTISVTARPPRARAPRSRPCRSTPRTAARRRRSSRRPA